MIQSKRPWTFAALVPTALLFSAWALLTSGPASAAPASCAGQAATIVVTDHSPHVVDGTGHRDVIAIRDPGHVVRAHAGDDLICGSGGHDTIYAGAGRDHVYGRAGSDTIRGGDGPDVIYGGSGNDYLYGGYGDDHLYGGYGDDHEYGGAGHDSCYGGAGHDACYGEECWGDEDGC